MQVKINQKLERLLTTHKPVKVAVGGRGSGKSLGFGDIFTVKMLTEGADIYCLREFQDSIQDSVHKVFKGSIEERLNLKGWDVQENRIIAPNGARTVYKGANRNPDAMQSAQGFKYSWFEEAHRASQASIDKLLPTIIRNKGAECWFSANPQSSADPFSQRFVVPYQDELYSKGIYEDDMHCIVLINWKDNPWWNDEQEALRQWDYKHQSRAHYDWIWEGKFNDTVENAIIDAEWFDAAIDSDKALGFEPRGQIVASFDPADEGGDAKGYALRHGSVFLKVDKMTTGDSIDCLDWAISNAIQDNADLFVWDCDGIGSGMKETITRSFKGKHTKLEMFKGSSIADNPNAIYQDYSTDIKNQRTNRQTFKNNRACRYWKLRDRFFKTYEAVVKGKYHDPDELISLRSDMPELQSIRAEVCRIPRKFNTSGFIQMLDKPTMLSRGIKSPNMADAMMMSLTDFEEQEEVNFTFSSEFG
jgi:phage terminase large subunit